MKRITWIDILKAISIFLVVVGHCLSGEKALEVFIYGVQVPMFFFTAGFVFKRREGDTFTGFFIKKFKQLLIPYYTFGIISIVIFMLLGRVAAGAIGTDAGSFDFLPNALALLYGSSKNGNFKFNLPLWFIPCLFSASLFFYLVHKLSDRFEKKNVYFGCAAVLFALTGYILNYKLQLPGMTYAVDTAVTMEVFFILGYMLQINQKLIEERKYLWLWAAGLIALGAFGALKNGRVYYATDEYNNLLLFYPSCIALIAGFCALSKAIEKNKVLEYVGKHTLAILVMHKFPILFFQVIAKPVGRLMAENNLLVIFPVAAVSIAMCLAAEPVIDRIAPWALGKNLNKK